MVGAGCRPMAVLMLMRYAVRAIGHFAQAHEWPSLEPQKSKNVVFTLIRGGDDPTDYRYYKKRCNCLHQTLTEPFDDVAFHEGNLQPKQTAYITKRWGVRIACPPASPPELQRPAAARLRTAPP